MEHTELKKETSIDWLMTQLYKKGFIKETDGNEPISLMNQAKEMEKQQIIDACKNFGNLNGVCIEDYNKYYNETFKESTEI